MTKPLSKKGKIAIIITAAALAILAGAFAWYVSDDYKPSEQAITAMATGSGVAISENDSFTIFIAENASPEKGFIFYPGGKVDYRAYAPQMRALAGRGVLCVLVHMPLNLAFFDTNAADRVYSLYPSVEQWYIGGHSLGGVAASSYAKANAGKISGLIFWASYPAEDLSKADLPVLSVHATNDAFTTPAKIDGTRRLLPADTRFTVIAGGNHSQFGDYGLQSGDNKADISAEMQLEQVVQATAAFINNPESSTEGVEVPMCFKTQP